MTPLITKSRGDVREITIMKTFRRFAFMLIVTATLGLVAPSATMADTYFVQRAWSNATLTGTMELPMGNYTITNRIPAPFTSIHLTLSVNGSQIALFTNALTTILAGLASFLSTLLRQL